MWLIGKAKVDCKPNMMMVALEKASMPNIDVNFLKLRDNTCSLTSNSTHIMASMSFTTCGTTIEVCYNFFTHTSMGSVINLFHWIVSPCLELPFFAFPLGYSNPWFLSTGSGFWDTFPLFPIMNWQSVQGTFPSFSAVCQDRHQQSLQHHCSISIAIW